MKKLINRPDQAVTEALQGMARSCAHLLTVHYDPTYVTRFAAPRPGKVALISGGGSGHEPLHAGFVGHGMLDAACPGAIFTSPTPDQILAASQHVNGGAGILYIVKNYTGDVLNFAIAAELAAGAGLPVARVLVKDDVAIQEGLGTAGRRGIGATLLVQKLCGAAAEEGRPLEALVALGQKVTRWARSMGMALTSCTVPAVGRPTFTLNEDEMEIGIGIHGEPGRERRALAPADQITELLVQPVLADLPFQAGDRLIALVNGMGSTPLLELYIVFRKLAQLCDTRDLTIARNLVGNYVTSLDMAGCSITLLKADDELLRLWDAPVHTAALRW